MALPKRIAEVRREVCATSCDVKCDAYLRGKVDHADPRASCPRRGWILAWGCYGPCDGPTPASKLPNSRLPLRRCRQVGDCVEIIAKPIARWLDRHFGTKLGGCSACNRRRTWLNAFDARLRAWLVGKRASLQRLFKRPPKRPSNPV